MEILRLSTIDFSVTKCDVWNGFQNQLYTVEWGLELKELDVVILFIQHVTHKI